MPDLPLLALDDEALRESLRLSLEPPGTFCIMVLGGSEEADPEYRKLFKNCNVFTLGNHEGAGIKGDWNDRATWARAMKQYPNTNAVVVDMGSDSWVTGNVGVYLADFLKSTKAMLLFSPPYNTDQWYDVMYPVPFLSDPVRGLKYIAVRLVDNHILLLYSDSLPAQPVFAGELLLALQECTMLMQSDPDRVMHDVARSLNREDRAWYDRSQAKFAERLKDCYRNIEAISHRAVEWNEGLQVLLSRVTRCVPTPAGF